MNTILERIFFDIPTGNQELNTALAKRYLDRLDNQIFHQSMSSKMMSLWHKATSFIPGPSSKREHRLTRYAKELRASNLLPKATESDYIKKIIAAAEFLLQNKNQVDMEGNATKTTIIQYANNRWRNGSISRTDLNTFKNKMEELVKPRDRNTLNNWLSSKNMVVEQ